MISFCGLEVDRSQKENSIQIDLDLFRGIIQSRTTFIDLQLEMKKVNRTTGHFRSELKSAFLYLQNDSDSIQIYILHSLFIIYYYGFFFIGTWETLPKTL